MSIWIGLSDETMEDKNILEEMRKKQRYRKWTKENETSKV